MQNKKFLFEKIGIVSEFISPYKAVIEFKLNNSIETAILRKDKYYHKGKHIPDDENLTEYISIGTEVIFSCHILNKQENEQHSSWFVMRCQKYEKIPKGRLKLKPGLVNISGCIQEVQRRHGVLFTDHLLEENSTIYFLASKFYLDGKRLPSSKALSEVLNVNDLVFFDAIPCIPEENEYHSHWFATLIYKGKRPECYKFADNKLFEMEEKFKKNVVLNQSYTSSPLNKKVIQSLEKSYIYNCIARYTNDPRTLFAFGIGMIMDIPNKEFGIILGQFEYNQFKTVLFHRKNAFLFKMCLAKTDLTQVFEEGDRVNFIAVGAPSDFITEWIAIQVSILKNGKEYKVPFNCQDDASMSSEMNQITQYE